jgi:beta-glucosidase
MERAAVPRYISNVSPPDFVNTSPFAWGISTSSYQFEDPAVVPGTPDFFETDWDVGLVRGGHAPPRGDALHSWTHFEKDLAALVTIGVSHYRFGIEWARIEPQPGVYNEAAIDRYVAMAGMLREAGIEPIVCLWHFTFPGWLYDRKHPRRSNWLHPEARPRWRAFLEKVVPRLAGEVRTFAPQNEPNGQLSTAYLAGLWPPARHLDFPAYHRALEECVGCFADAVEIVRRVRGDAQILGIHALPWWTHGKFDPEDAIFKATVHNSLEHLDRVAPLCDLIGINYYFSQPASIVGFATSARIAVRTTR